MQIDVDATAMTLAGNGTSYITRILQKELAGFGSRSEGGTALPIKNVSVRSKFNPNLESSWFMAVMQIVGNITMLSLILSGAAVIRQHGTIEHLLVMMPVTPAEIMLAKIWANGIVIVAAALLSFADPRLPRLSRQDAYT